MMFARSIADDNQIYYDADYAATTEPGKVLPANVRPVQCQLTRTTFAAEMTRTGFWVWQRSHGIKRESGSGGGGGGGGGLHAEQHFEYHRHIGPGDVLTAEVKPGKTWEKEGKRLASWFFQKPLLNTGPKW
ncbi:MAG: hypothetical protein CM15mP120_26550 [Pseudomonadota bacterium]|nr:MAG: hypothetical protein CM15mP120_26550 [Pseudomonadota bacterium]